MTKKAEREARIAAKAAEKAAKLAAEQARIQSNPIFAAIAPQRAEAIERAVAFTRERLEKFVERFPVGGNFKELAPAPSSLKDHRTAYKSKQAYRSLAQRVIKVARGGWPEYTETVEGVDEEGIERLCNEAADEAAISFDAYVAKLTSKVGACDAAAVEGRLWSSSILTVTKGSSVERWHTQQILNFSVYGKAFNQWPTRKLKAGGAA